MKEANMYLNIERVSVDYDSRALILTESERPVFSWTVRSDGDRGHQSSYRIVVSDDKGVVWDSGEVAEKAQKATYGGKDLENGEIYSVSVVIKDTRGVASTPRTAKFRYLAPREWAAEWISPAKESEWGAKYFYKGFSVDEKPVRATLFASGLGYQYVTVNGVDVEGSFLNPAVSAYHKRCYYTVTDVTDAVLVGENKIFAVVGDGWRDPKGFFRKLSRGLPDFFGDTRFIAELELLYADGRAERVSTDADWLAGYGAITSQSLFDGETYDARCALDGWDTMVFSGVGLEPAAICGKSNIGELVPQTHPPVLEYKRLKACNIYKQGDDAYILDFGENIAGIGCLKLPENLAAGRIITIEYDEELFDGDLGKETLRKAKATDTYIAGEKNLAEWTPRLCYHGFRYAKISGLGERPSEDTLMAIAFCNDVKNRSFFKCGSALVTKIHEIAVRTEMGNIHHIATDCPQRDERMGWMNDATVRFEEMPYNFHVGRIYKKILRDMFDEQDPVSGGITCTAPFIWGSRPADPVCSSYLVLGLQLALHYGDLEAIREYYEPYKKWNDCIAALKDGEGIVAYSKYGDWASPEDYCTVRKDGDRSAVTDPFMMSTGYHYYNYILLARFAELIGKKEEQVKFLAEAQNVREAFLNKWFDKESGCVGNGSQGAQAFGLWLGIIPPEYEKKAAKRMSEAVELVGYRLTTGNLTTKYLFDMLAKFGYEDVAWRLLCREEYPSWGYMIQNGATTVWERFEQKRGSRMNSHNHPMYGAVDYWFYAYLLGVKPLGEGYERFEIAPVFPKGLGYAEGVIDTSYGDIYVCWRRQFEHIYITVDVPFGTTAILTLKDGKRELPCGVHHISFED